MLFTHHRQNSILQRTLEQDQRDWQKQDNAACEPGGCCTVSGSCDMQQTMFARPAEAPVFKAAGQQAVVAR